MEKEKTDEVRGRDGLEDPASPSLSRLLMTQAETNGNEVKQELPQLKEPPAR
jgi:hypothetical protein